MAELPRDLPVLARDVVQLVVRDALDRILLFHTHEPTAPELGQWWELPGDGIDPGETYDQAAIRELWEDPGIAVGDGRIRVLVADPAGTSADVGIPPKRQPTTQPPTTPQRCNR